MKIKQRLILLALLVTIAGGTTAVVGNHAPTGTASHRSLAIPTPLAAGYRMPRTWHW